MLKRTTSIAFLLVCGLYLGFSQNVNMKHFTTSDGLPSNEVFHVMQDSTGYIWFCTNNGVSRYDGYEFDNFTDGVLTGKALLYSYQDYKDRIWFASLGGKLFYFKNDSIHKFEWNNKLVKAFEGSPIPLKRGLHVDSSDNVYFAVRPDGIYKISSSGDLKHWVTPGRERTFVNDLGNKAIISRYSIHGDSIFVIKNDSVVYSLKNLQLRKKRGLSLIEKLGKDHYLLSSGVHVMEVKDQELKKLNHDKNNFIIEMKMNQARNIWLGYKKHGVKRFKDKNLKNSDLQLLKGRSVSSVLKDAHGGMWFGTLNKGCYYKPSKGIKSLANSNLLSSKNISYARIDKNGKIIIGTADNYINIIDNFREDSEAEYQRFQLNDSRPVKNTSALMQNHRIYFATDLFLYQASNYQYEDVRRVELVNKRIKNDTIVRNTGSVNTMCNLPGNQIAMGNAYGYFCSFSGSVTDSMNIKYIEWFLKDRVSSIIYDSLRNSAWIGTYNGLYQHQLNSDSLIYHGRKDSSLTQRIVDVKPLANRKLALATKSNGLIFYDIGKNVTTLINERNGMSSNQISSLAVNSDYLWAGTNYGISMINISAPREHIVQITTSDGLASNAINDIWINDSAVLVSTTKGLSYFNVKELNFNKESSAVYIKTISVPNQEVIHNPENKFEIAYPQNSLRLNYTSLTYDHDQDLTYKYRLRGLEDSWKYTSRNEIFFSYIPPGDYTFEIMVRNKDGVWSEKPRVVEFSVESPVWGSNWFITLMAVAIILIISSIMYLLFRNYQIKTQAKHDITRYQHQALSNQMNPHFLFNSLNSIHRYILENNSSYASKFLSKFARLTRLFLKNSQNHRIPISKELESIRLYLELENMRMKNKFDYTFDIDKNIDPSKIEIPSMLLQPIVENAVIHGIRYLHDRRGNINITIKKKGPLLQFTIEDNGVGRNKAAEIEQKNPHQSFGDSIISKRIELLNQLHNSFISLNYIDLYSENAGVGTKVILDNFPITYHYVEDVDS
ncbi:MAG: histidine kinase [Bacteroidales bacterium]|nr:histidine kinase [Bacteroidales bacterium]